MGLPDLLGGIQWTTAGVQNRAILKTACNCRAGRCCWDADACSTGKIRALPPCPHHCPMSAAGAGGTHYSGCSSDGRDWLCGRSARAALGWVLRPARLCFSLPGSVVSHWQGLPAALLELQSLHLGAPSNPHVPPGPRLMQSARCATAAPRAWRICTSTALAASRTSAPSARGERRLCPVA